MLPWALRNSMAGGSIYYQVLLMVNPYRPEKGYLDTIGVLYRLMDQLILYVNDYLPEVVLPLFAESSPAMAMMAILVSVLAVATVFLCIRRRQHLLVLTYAALLFPLCQSCGFLRSTHLQRAWAGSVLVKDS
jgi:hypothetical protein